MTDLIELLEIIERTADGNPVLFSHADTLSGFHTDNGHAVVGTDGPRCITVLDMGDGMLSLTWVGGTWGSKIAPADAKALGEWLVQWAGARA
jgi:hypothetical protein